MSLPSFIPASMKQAVKANSSASFPSMVHQCFVDIEELGKRDPAMKKLQKIVSWQNHGRAFRIHDRKKFEEVIMPVWFIRLKYNSFLRQLSLFGFKKIYRDTPDVQKGAWYHDLFIQGQPEVAKHIQKMGKNNKPASQPPAIALHFQQTPGTGFGSFGAASEISKMHSAMSDSTLSYLKLKSSLAQPPHSLPPATSSQTSGLVNMPSGAAFPMELPTNAGPSSVFFGQGDNATRRNSHSSNPMVGLVLENLDQYFLDEEENDNATELADLEPTPIPPGGFVDATPSKASKHLQQELFDMFYPAANQEATEPLAFPGTPQSPFPWAA